VRWLDRHGALNGKLCLDHRHEASCSRSALLTTKRPTHDRSSEASNSVFSGCDHHVSHHHTRPPSVSQSDAPPKAATAPEQSAEPGFISWPCTWGNKKGGVTTVIPGHPAGSSGSNDMPISRLLQNDPSLPVPFGSENDKFVVWGMPGREDLPFCLLLNETCAPCRPVVSVVSAPGDCPRRRAPQKWAG